MRKTVLTFVILATSLTLTSCNSLDRHTVTSAFSEKGENEVIRSSEATSNADVETSDEFTYLNNLGIYQLTKNDIVWNHFLYGEYSFDTDIIPQTIDVDGKKYIELSTANCNNLQELQDVLNINLEKKENDLSYLCPFNSLENLKSNLCNTYTDKYVEYLLSYIPLIEYENSLFISDNGGVFPEREPICVSIDEKKDAIVTFSVKYSLPDIEGVYLTTTYEAVYENDKWLINNRINNP